MIEQLHQMVQIQEEDMEYIQSLDIIDLPIHWEDPDGYFEAVKADIRHDLEMNQTHCCYCGLILGGTSKGQIDHIAPKDVLLYPQFTFEPLNLALSCGYCNGFEKKRNTDTVSNLVDDYEDCQFYLVHPYFDDPDDHYAWIDDQWQVVIQSKTEKGTFSIGLFDLDSPKMSILRAQEKRYVDMLEQWELTPDQEDLLDKVMNYKRQ